MTGQSPPGPASRRRAIAYVDIPIAAQGDEGCWREIVENVYRVHWKVAGVERIGPARQTLRVAYADRAVPEAVVEAITAVSTEICKSHQRMPVEVVFSHAPRERRRGGDAIRELVARGALRLTPEGGLEASGVFRRVMERLGHELRRYAADLGAQAYDFPSLLSLELAQQCGIFDKQPQHVHFVTSARYTRDGLRGGLAALTSAEADGEWSGELARPELILAPAVCYHSWRGAREWGPVGSAMRMGTATGRCYRAEVPALLGLDRLREFTMWEIFAVGSPDETRALRLRSLEYIKEVLRRLDLVGRVATASDPFFVDVHARTRMFQVNMRLKHELQLWLPHTGEDVAVASVNDHRDFFTRAFGIAGDGDRRWHSCCLAFGLERLTLAVLSQHGLEPQHWPSGLASIVGA